MANHWFRELLQIILLSGSAGLAGTWLVSRRLTFFSHGLSIGTLPAFTLARGLGLSAVPFVTMVALVYSAAITRGKRLSAAYRSENDTTTAVLMTTAVAIAVVLANGPFSGEIQLQSLLIGNVASPSTGDLILASSLAVTVGISARLFQNHWLKAEFDDQPQLDTRGQLLDVSQLVVLSFAVLAATSLVGTLLASAFLILPAVTIRIWDLSFARWQVASVCFSVMTATTGLLISSAIDLPAGPVIATLGFLLFLISIAFNSGLFYRRSASKEPAIFTVLSPAAFALLAALAASTATQKSTKADEKIPTIVATTPIVADLVNELVRDNAKVVQLVPNSVDQHDFEPGPATSRTIRNADLVVRSGDGIDSWAEKIITNLKAEKKSLALDSLLPIPLAIKNNGHLESHDHAESADTETHEHGKQIDPHWWHNTKNMAAVADSLTKWLKSNSSINLNWPTSYAARIKQLDQELLACYQTIEPRRRVIITNHDSLAYLADRFQIHLVPAIIPARGGLGQTSSKQLDLVRKVAQNEGATAIFPETGTNTNLVKSLAAQLNITIGQPLYTDSLGKSDSEASSYIKMMQSNAQKIVSAVADTKFETDQKCQFTQGVR